MGVAENSDFSINPHAMIRPGRKITGMSAILLPFAADGSVDWQSFDRHVGRTAAAGLTPAVNMDTGYVNLIDEPTAITALDRAKAVLAGRPFVAGAFVADSPGDTFNPDAYCRRIEAIASRGGTPVIFQSFGLTGLDDNGVVEAYRKIAGKCGKFIGFELGQMFAPFGRIYSLPVYESLMGIPQCIGAKHSSLSRRLEWQRLALRDRIRPDFKVFTGNDLAIDMVIYGSDYLLGLSTFAPDIFALRDRLWRQCDAGFYELNDLLQYLGFFAFRDPVPGYKHNAAQFLKLRGWIATDRTHPGSPARGESDITVLRDILDRLEGWRGK
ncbi:MAG: dihydrodipicolinate synthase family protein [Planctomycetes bacterium]|nr:dihydrodipicolinate synthase family protein [Planctomycetota bacterium]